jgi:tRNA(Ile)-lysidine synthetase-like protein
VTVPEALRRAAETGLLPRGASVLLAVSGGADSMALLRGCAEVVPETGWSLAVGHVHHGLRGREADRDLAFVREHARRLGLPFLSRRIDARAVARELGISPEAGARHGRYEALAGMAREAGATRIAVAHQRNDVAETHLVARARRGGVFALAGPRERRADGVVRPLLEVTRQDILDYLESRGIPYRRDSSNGDLRLSRNRARRELAHAGRGRIEELADAAKASAGERDAVEREIERRFPPRLHAGPGSVLVDAGFLASCPRELARRGLSEAAVRFALPGRPPLTGRERERILELLAGGADFRFEAGRRIRFERRGGILRIAPRPEVAAAGPKV